uniref:protein-tyrosine-phosphatase n=1 Tax=Amphimedon queenslandica TaxID=400682 RepID=A0A1X7U9D4_AMPQE
DQYIFVNDAVLESVTCGNTQVDSRNARIVFNRMSKPDTKTGQTGYEEQFTVLQQVTQRPDEVTHNIASQNNDKNRSTQFLPPNNHRVPLKNEHPDYINAVFINGYKEKKAFIIAESPMFNTARNFWKMIDDRNVTAIVMLCHENENDEEVCYQYWPSTSIALVIGEYNITLLNENTNNRYIERKFEVKNNNTGVKQSVTQFQITNWDSTGEVKNPQTILMIIEEMYRTQRKRGNTSIVVHCSDTVGRSAMFCAAATTINKCKTEGVIDVFQVLKSQRIQKPGSVQTVVSVQLYLAYEDRIMSDYSMIHASQFYDTDQNNDSINDALWCQSANTSTNIGVWYYPNGTEVPLFDGDFGDNSAPRPLFSKRFSGQIALARREGLSGYEGLYKCIIPDENGVNQTVVVGAYTDTGYNNNDGPDADPTMQFSLLSTSRLATPPVFSLSFNVSDGPPTTVSCSVNGTEIFTELFRVIVNGPGSVIRVTLINLTEAGNYQCNVSNDRVTNGPISSSSGANAVNSTSLLNISADVISVSDTPTGLTAERLSTGLAHVRLSWSTVSGAIGYEIFSKFSTLTPVSVGTTASTTINITSGLFRDTTYTFSVVSYGTAFIPSGAASVVLTISDPIVNDFMTSVATNSTITLTWSPPTAIVPTSYNIIRDCKRVCESSTTGNTDKSVSSPHTSTGIPPYSQCTFDLNGVYDAIAELTTGYLAETLSTAPTAPVDDIMFSSVESVSMTVSWDEVPCNGRNGPITGYYLTYTNITSNTSYTVNITGGDNRMYNLTGLIPYTNYTVSIIPYNYNMNGPARQEIELTGESIPGVISDLRHAKNPDAINIIWNPPTIPNGIITVYEIRYRESTSTGPYNITNTTNTYYGIFGLIPNTSYTIGVRAYTSIGPGDWTDREYTTGRISVLEMFFVTKLSSTAVRAEWNLIHRASHYTVYYESTSSSSRKKRQVETGMKVFPGGTTEGLIGGLDPNLNYLFSISISYTVNGIVYEGERTQPIPPADIPTSTSDAANGSSAIFIAIGAVVCILVLIVIIAIIVVVIVLKKRRSSKNIDIVSKNTSANKPEATVYYSTCKNNNNDAGYEEIGLERIEEATYSAVMKPKKPVIEEFPSNMTTEEGCQVLLKVKVKETSKPSFNWYHNGEPVTDDYAHELRGDGSLLLVSVEEKHEGTYRFVANNDAGTVSQQVVLTVAVEGARMSSNGTSAGKSGKNLIPVRQFGKFVANGHAKGKEEFKTQFTMLDSGESEHSATVGLSSSNKLLNRFANIVVYDDNRIILRPISGHKDCPHEYINACYVDGYSSDYQYIATQGPMSKTLVDFWCLVWQERPPVIVMVTN